MGPTIVTKVFLTITFPSPARIPSHVPSVKLHSLARKQLPDLEVIETIEHLFKCHRCFENYRLIRTSHLPVL